MHNATENLFLVGMMGAGKSAVGRQMASRLGLAFVDTDHEIRQRTGVSVSVIFEVEGESGFRQREERLIDELSQQDGVVMATGGGAILSEATRLRLKQRGFTIYLHAKVHDLWLRTRNDRSRPLLACDDPKQRLEELLRVRDPLYREVADLVVETGRPSVTQLVDSIERRLAERASARVGAIVDQGGDASVDAGDDATVDAGDDATVDAGNDATVDAGDDATVDAVDQRR